MSAIDAVPWAVWTIVLPLAAATLTFLFGPRSVSFFAWTTSLGILTSVAGLTRQVSAHGPWRYSIAAWEAPLGIELYADGFSVLMLVMTALVAAPASVYSQGYYPPARRHSAGGAPDAPSARAYFWPLWFFLWSSLNAMFLAADVFNIFVTLELLGISSVALVALGGSLSALVAALRYLLVTLLGSSAYLLGVALLYSAYGLLDVMLLRDAVAPGPAAWAAAALMTVGLAIKSALYPMHFWLPPAHGNAPAPVSALLSAVVVKGSLYLLLRLWFFVFSPVLTPSTTQWLGGLGAAAVVWGSLQAIRQSRLKLLLAYSTVAQLGYLFLTFPLVGLSENKFTAWSGGVFLALADACGKGAAFLAAGTITHAFGHDRIEGLKGVGHQLPLCLLSFALAGISLIGLPPSGGFVGKWILLSAALESGQWGFAGILVLGSLLAAVYVFRVLELALRATSKKPLEHKMPRSMEWTTFALGLLAVGLGLVATRPLQWLEIGFPFSLESLLHAPTSRP